MPWLDDTQPGSRAAQEWKSALKNAFVRRLQAPQMTAVFPELASKYPASPDEIATILMGFRARSGGMDDALIFNFARTLLQQKIIGTSHLLLALLNTSRFGRRPDAEQPDKPHTGFPTCEEVIFSMLFQMHFGGDLALTISEAHGLAFALTRWMHVVAEYEMGKQLEDGALHTADALSFGIYEAIASLSLTILSDSNFRDVTKQPWWKNRRPVIVSEIESFDTHVLQWMQSQLAGRLRMLATMPPFIEVDAKGRPVFTDDQVMQAVLELPVVTSRAGLFIWLNACLCSRPLTDDLSMLTYLQTRYSGNNQSLAVDLLVASFDVLTNTLLQKEDEHNLLVVRSFVCNKVPHLLGIVSGFMAPAMTVEACIQMAFISITMDALPPISAGSTDVRERLQLTRLEFLQACALHGLITDNTVAAILQDPSVSLPRVNKYTKEGLLAQCNNNVGRLEPLIDELEDMLGNAPAIVGCIVDTINNICLNKDTISLKTVCNLLIKKISTVDIMMQYTQPANLLLGLCTQLNDWTHDQDQTEFTPAYEEFASMLLFVLAVVHRYGLDRADLGLLNDESFIGRLLEGSSISKLPSDLTEDQDGQLARWIESLYATDEDGQASGIGDDVMRQCPPRAFYELVPTLFEQSVLACKSGKLSMKTFKGGLELLVEPFLLPSLVGGLSWVVQHSWEDHGDAEVLLQVLEKLLKPSSSSQDTKAMHRAVLSIIVKPLYLSLQNLSQRRAEKRDVNALIDLLKPYLGQRRIIESSMAEMDEWLSTPDGGIARCIRNAIRDLVLWVSSVGPTPPPKYTHELFAAGCEAIGVDAMRDAIIAELKEQTSIGNGPLTLDICTALICAPQATSQPPLVVPIQSQSTPPTVRDALRLETADVQKLLRVPEADAEALVRLTRRVEAQLAVTQIPQITMPIPMQDQATDQMMADLGLTDGSLAANTSLDQVADLSAASAAEFSNVDLTSALDQPMDLTNPLAQNMANLSSDPGAMPIESQSIFNDINMEMSQPPQQMLDSDGIDMGLPSGDGQQNPDDDIFAGIDLGDGFSFS